MPKLDIEIKCSRLTTLHTKIRKVLASVSWGHVRPHTKFGPDRFSRFDVIGYKQTNIQTPKLNLYIDR